MLDDGKQLLIAAGDCARGQRLHRICAAHGPVKLAHSGQQAMHELKGMPGLCALVVGTCLPDASALDVAGEARRRFTSPILIVATNNSHAIVHGAFDLCADYLCTPISDRQVDLFAQRASNRSALRQAAFSRAASALASQVSLTPREQQIVELAIAGVRRRDITDAIGIAESTLKWHIRSLLNKCDATNLAEVVRIAIANDDGSTLRLSAEG
ncbi:MAG: LuxR C-terminal-related transcriptional regulator [Myxococcales bacterium]|nr:LuxR C-terminal-related transcriptional regulator [Myxococcales bacterium]